MRAPAIGVRGGKMLQVGSKTNRVDKSEVERLRRLGVDVAEDGTLPLAVDAWIDHTMGIPHVVLGSPLHPPIQCRYGGTK